MALRGAELTNFLMHVQSSIFNRPSTQYVNTSKTDAFDPPSKLITFIYNNAQSYVLEFGDRYVHFISNRAYLANTDGTPYELATPIALQMPSNYVTSNLPT